MYRDGYLVKYDGHSSTPQLVFSILDEGRLSFYSRKGGVCLSQLALTGNVVKVLPMRAERHKLPHRFMVVIQSIRCRNGVRSLDHKIVVELCAPTADLMKDWANSVHLWRRMNWKENVQFSKSTEEINHEREQKMLEMYMKAIEGPINNPGIPFSRKLSMGFLSNAKRPFSPFSFSSLKRFGLNRSASA